MNTGSVEERLASIEATLPYLATKEDVQSLRADHQSLRAEHQTEFNRFTRWIIGLLLVAGGVAISLLLAIDKIAAVFSRGG